MFETFDHTADIGVRGRGADYLEAFSEAAKGMFSVMADLALFHNDIEIALDCSAGDRELLLVEFLNQLLFQAAVNRCIWNQFLIESMNETSLKARVCGEKIKPAHKNALRIEVKAATLAELKVYEADGMIFAQCVVDI